MQRCSLVCNDEIQNPEIVSNDQQKAVSIQRNATEHYHLPCSTSLTKDVHSHLSMTGQIGPNMETRPTRSSEMNVTPKQRYLRENF